MVITKQVTEETVSVGAGVTHEHVPVGRKQIKE